MSGELYILHFARLLLLCNCELPHHITVRSIIYAKLSYAMYVLEAIRPRIYCNMFMSEQDENSTMLTWRIAFV